MQIPIADALDDRCVSARRCCVPATPQNQASEGNKDQVNSWRADYTL